MSVLLRFGLPTVPAEASVYALSIVDRYYIYHDRSQALAGLYSIAVKLAGAVAFIVRAFQYAWPPLAYSIEDDAQASRLYGLVTTYYLCVSGWVVAGLACSGAGSCGCSRRPPTPGPTARCRGLPWAGRCTAYGWCSWSSPAGPR